VSLDDLRLLFPPPGAVLTQGDTVIRAMGGRRPFAFLVDGQKLPAEPSSRQTRWTPPSAGFYRLTVLDADGQTTQAIISVK
jgi:penicillin-binding protein 1C